jgi:hypothetical protein
LWRVINFCKESLSVFSLWFRLKRSNTCFFLFCLFSSHVTRRAHSDHETMYCNLLHLFTVIMIVKFKGAVSQGFCQEFKIEKEIKSKILNLFEPKKDITEVRSFIKQCLHIFTLWKQIRFTKPFQASPYWHQLKYLVFMKWKNTVSKMNGFRLFFLEANFARYPYTSLAIVRQKRQLGKIK